MKTERAKSNLIPQRSVQGAVGPFGKLMLFQSAVYSSSVVKIPRVDGEKNSPSKNH